MRNPEFRYMLYKNGQLIKDDNTPYTTNTFSSLVGGVYYNYKIVDGRGYTYTNVNGNLYYLESSESINFTYTTVPTTNNTNNNGIINVYCSHHAKYYNYYLYYNGIKILSAVNKGSSYQFSGLTGERQYTVMVTDSRQDFIPKPTEQRVLFFSKTVYLNCTKQIVATPTVTPATYSTTNNNGIVNFVVSFGFPPYKINFIKDGTTEVYKTLTTSLSTFNLSELDCGQKYNVTITDGRFVRQPSIKSNYTVIVDSAEKINSTVNITRPKNYDNNIGSDGQIDIIVNKGKSPFSYILTGGSVSKTGTFPNNYLTINNLPGDVTYSLTLNDSRLNSQTDFVETKSFTILPTLFSNNFLRINRPTSISNNDGSVIFSLVCGTPKTNTPNKNTYIYELYNKSTNPYSLVTSGNIGINIQKTISGLLSVQNNVNGYSLVMKDYGSDPDITIDFTVEDYIETELTDVTIVKTDPTNETNDNGQISIYFTPAISDTNYKFTIYKYNNDTLKYDFLLEKNETTPGTIFDNLKYGIYKISIRTIHYYYDSDDVLLERTNDKLEYEIFQELKFIGNVESYVSSLRGFDYNILNIAEGDTEYLNKHTVTPYNYTVGYDIKSNLTTVKQQGGKINGILNNVIVDSLSIERGLFKYKMTNTVFNYFMSGDNVYKTYDLSTYNENFYSVDGISIIDEGKDEKSASLLNNTIQISNRSKINSLSLYSNTPTVAITTYNNVNGVFFKVKLKIKVDSGDISFNELSRFKFNRLLLSYTYKYAYVLPTSVTDSPISFSDAIITYSYETPNTIVLDVVKNLNISTLLLTSVTMDGLKIEYDKTNNYLITISPYNGSYLSSVIINVVDTNKNNVVINGTTKTYTTFSANNYVGVNLNLYSYNLTYNYGKEAVHIEYDVVPETMIKNDGKINFRIFGGNKPYHYTLTDTLTSTIKVSDNTDYIGLVTGLVGDRTYKLDIVDSDDKIGSKLIRVEDPYKYSVSVEYNVVSPDTSSNNNGKIILSNISNDYVQTSYSVVLKEKVTDKIVYDLQGVTSPRTLSDLYGGKTYNLYVITETITQGIVKPFSVDIDVPNTTTLTKDIDLTITSTTPTTTGGTDGTITIKVTDDTTTSPYFMEIDKGSESVVFIKENSLGEETITGLSGTEQYFIFVSDSTPEPNTKIYEDFYIIGDKIDTELIGTTEFISPTVEANDNGKIIITITNGKGDYTYKISYNGTDNIFVTSSKTHTFENLTGGYEYVVTVTDLNGVVYTKTQTMLGVKTLTYSVKSEIILNTVSSSEYSKLLGIYGYIGYSNSTPDSYIYTESNMINTTTRTITPYGIGLIKLEQTNTFVNKLIPNLVYKYKIDNFLFKYKKENLPLNSQFDPYGASTPLIINNTTSSQVVYNKQITDAKLELTNGTRLVDNLSYSSYYERIYVNDDPSTISILCNIDIKIVEGNGILSDDVRIGFNRVVAEIRTQETGGVVNTFNCGLSNDNLLPYGGNDGITYDVDTNTLKYKFILLIPRSAIVNNVPTFYNIKDIYLPKTEGTDVDPYDIYISNITSDVLSVTGSTVYTDSQYTPLMFTSTTWGIDSVNIYTFFGDNGIEPVSTNITNAKMTFSYTVT